MATASQAKSLNLHMLATSPRSVYPVLDLATILSQAADQLEKLSDEYGMNTPLPFIMEIEHENGKSIIHINPGLDADIPANYIYPELLEDLQLIDQLLPDDPFGPDELYKPDEIVKPDDFSAVDEQPDPINPSQFDDSFTLIDPFEPNFLHDTNEILKYNDNSELDDEDDLPF